ncbi:MAG: bifunctional tetrahydrofolate synthase/dihydrofolate synthase [Marinicellaceae bacterium]
MAKSHKSLQQWLNKLETSHNKKIDLGLTRVKTVYDNLKLEKVAPTIITVAGTNGKGSTVAILTSIIKQSGIKVGAFTSPHLVRFNERICIDNQEVSDKDIVAAFELIENHLNGVTLSYFEYATLAALIIFKQNKIDVAVLEVGLGGRLDSVNVVDADCAIITTVDIDHTEWLGNDIESIALEKAGIMRENKPVIYGDTDCPLTIIQHADDTGAQLILPDYPQQSFVTNLKGTYQQKNITTAITALNTLDLLITENNIKQALVNVVLKGRLQVIAKDPVVILDVSHNHQAAIELSQWLDNNRIDGKTIAVFSVLNDKKVSQWLPLFKGNVDVWCVSEVKSHRTMKLNELVRFLADTATLITSYPEIKQAYKGAHLMANKNDRLLVFGSFYTVSEVLAG